MLGSNYMLRFILNFILFGILFYLIWRFFPEAFDKLVSWAGDVFDFVKNLFTSTVEKLQEKKH